MPGQFRVACVARAANFASMAAICAWIGGPIGSRDPTNLGIKSSHYEYRRRLTLTVRPCHHRRRWVNYWGWVDNSGFQPKLVSLAARKRRQ
jgi:hypothetical protein